MVGREQRVVVVLLDAFERECLEQWTRDGDLPHLADLEKSGIYLPFDNGASLYPAESPWTMLWTGASPERSGYWSDYGATREYRPTRAPFDYDRFGPFFLHDTAGGVAAIDLPHAPVRAAPDSLQLVGWGAHSPMFAPASHPPELRASVVARFGEHPAFGRDRAGLRSAREMKRLLRWLLDGIRRRSALSVSLLRERRDRLTLVAFGEMHSAGHWLWHLHSPSHPLHRRYRHVFEEDPLKTVARALDGAVGEIVEAAGPDATIVVAAQEGMGDNAVDVASNLFLPELLFRLETGRAGLTSWRTAAGAADERAFERPQFRRWLHEVWSTREDGSALARLVRQALPPRFGRRVEAMLDGSDGALGHPYDFEDFYKPPVWYSPAWPKMRAFALAAASSGSVRLNVRGREASGIVAPGDFLGVRGEIAASIGALTDARSGEPLVERIVATREDPMEDGPAADLVVVWRERACDVAGHPDAGRIGPFPFERSGSHTTHAFLVAGGPGVEATAHAGETTLVDIAPTVLALAGMEAPPHLEGTARLRRNPAVVGARPGR